MIDIIKKFIIWLLNNLKDFFIWIIDQINLFIETNNINSYIAGLDMLYIQIFIFFLFVFLKIYWLFTWANKLRNKEEESALFLKKKIRLIGFWIICTGMFLFCVGPFVFYILFCLFSLDVNICFDFPHAQAANRVFTIIIFILISAFFCFLSLLLTIIYNIYHAKTEQEFIIDYETKLVYLSIYSILLLLTHTVMSLFCEREHPGCICDWGIILGSAAEINILFWAMSIILLSFLIYFFIFFIWLYVGYNIFSHYNIPFVLLIFFMFLLILLYLLTGIFLAQHFGLCMYDFKLCCVVKKLWIAIKWIIKWLFSR
jgi:hypothetical protein